jgi:hypothetical protein
VSRDYDPVPGQWYENLEEEDSFNVMKVDEDSELIHIQHLDGEIEEIDLDTWAEMDLEMTDVPEGWSASDVADKEDEEEEEEEEEEDDWDEDEDDDEDDDWDEEEESDY